MKLNYKRTILVGFAFFLISAFWQAYDATIALTLTNKFGMSQGWSGVVMALDNILALFLLPFFGTLSDKHKSKAGRRTPFIRLGTVIAAVALVGLSFVDNTQLAQLQDVSAMDDPAALSTLYQTQGEKTLMTPEGDEFVLSQVFSEEDFTKVMTNNKVYLFGTEDAPLACSVYEAEQLEALGIAEGSSGTIREKDRVLQLTYCSSEEFGKVYDDEAETLLAADGNTLTLMEEYSLYTNYVVPARQAYAADRTAANSTPLILFMCVLFVLLLAMGIFRSPAVALMPDVTVKPLRSKANAIINLMGTAGGIIVLVLGLGFAFNISGTKNALMSYTPYYITIAALMLVALGIFLTTVREPQWAAQMQQDSVRYGIEEEDSAGTEKKTKLNKDQVFSLICILLSVALWYFGYNAVTSKYSVYAPNVLQMGYNDTMLIAQGFAIVAYLPAGMIATKIGRKKTILAGVVMLATAFGAASFMRAGSPAWVMYIMFALAGVAWATINVNSFPMVVEMCSGSDVGKYTGFYYTFSMAAQTLTPMFSGMLMDKLGMTVLFPYATIFVGLAFVTMFLVKHGDAKPEVKQGLEAFDND